MIRPRKAYDTPETRLDHISVCVCTYQRPELLARALDGILSQITPAAFTLEVVITDNDHARSAQEVVRAYQKNHPCRITYDCEPEQSIALARNRTVHNATGNLIATIDDDEFPAEDWLHQMYSWIKQSQADGVLGPVLPHFPSGAPKWLEKSGLCERPRHASGSPVGIKDLRTGNALFQRHIFGEDEIWFDPARGRGGEDGEFLSRQMRRGRKFVWCDEALVYETVPKERWLAGYYLRRYFMIGAMAGEYHRRSHHAKAVLIDVPLLLGYAAMTPFSFLTRKHIWMRVLTKVSYHAGCLLSFLHLVQVPQRP